MNCPPPPSSLLCGSHSVVVKSVVTPLDPRKERVGGRMGKRRDGKTEVGFGLGSEAREEMEEDRKCFVGSYNVSFLLSPCSSVMPSFNQAVLANANV